MGIGTAKDWTVHAAELMAINRAIEIVGTEENGAVEEQEDLYTIVSDSQSAIQAISNPSARPGQALVQRILRRVEALHTQQIKIRLFWIPGHSGNDGNEAADLLGKKAVNLPEQQEFGHLLSTYRKASHRKIQDEWEREWAASTKGQHLKRIDEGPLSRRSLRVYGTLTRHHTYFLAQLRTGHSWLATHARRHKFTEDGRCVCGAIETVVHVLVDCPRLQEARRQLRRQVGDAFNCIATTLGGRPRNEQGKASNSGINREALNAVLEFADAFQRFKSRAPAARPREQHRP